MFIYALNVLNLLIGLDNISVVVKTVFDFGLEFFQDLFVSLNISVVVFAYPTAPTAHILVTYAVFPVNLTEFRHRHFYALPEGQGSLLLQGIRV